MMENFDVIDAVTEFTKAAGCTTDKFNVRQTGLYYGLICEEFAECENATNYLKEEESDLEYSLKNISPRYKSGELDVYFEKADRTKLAHELCDLMWVTTGALLSMGVDVKGAMAELARANMGKTVLIDGKRVVIKDENGKVQKPEGWTAADISPFVK
jgi:predicted HAD superfamily Cof-like phosphohydrolase